MSETTESTTQTIDDVRLELVEARRRRDAANHRLRASEERVDALMLSNRALSEERDQALRQVQPLQEELGRVRRQLAITEDLGVELQRRVTDLEAVLSRTVVVAEASESGARA